MAISSRFAIQQVFELTLFDVATNECLGIMSDLKNTTFTQEGETVYASGEINNTL